MTKAELFNHIDRKLKSFPRFQITASDVRDVLKTMIDALWSDTSGVSSVIRIKGDGNTSSNDENGDWKIEVNSSNTLCKYKRVAGSWQLIEEDMF